MWKQIIFDGVIGEFGYKIEDEFFHINCFLSSPDFQGAKVYAHSKTGDKSGLCLGSFSPDGKGFSLVKSYPLSFFEANSIEIANENEAFFSLKSQRGEIFSKDDIFSDPAVIRARELTENHPATSESQKLSLEYKEEIQKKLSSYPVEALPVFSDYTFHIIDNIKHPFKLSSIDHIVHSPEFVSAFVNAGKWYMGEKSNSNIFAICICSPKEGINPMSNASDCDYTFEDSTQNMVYHTVGIGLYEDGQYFCKLEK